MYVRLRRYRISCSVHTSQQRLDNTLQPCDTASRGHLNTQPPLNIPLLLPLRSFGSHARSSLTGYMDSVHQNKCTIFVCIAKNIQDLPCLNHTTASRSPTTPVSSLISFDIAPKDETACNWAVTYFGQINPRWVFLYTYYCSHAKTHAKTHAHMHTCIN